MRSSRRLAIYVGSLSSNERKKLVYGVQPRWRRDGRELYLYSASGEAMAVEISATQDGAFKAGVPRRLFATILASTVTERNAWDVTPDGQRFLVNSSTSQTAQAAGQITPITVVVNWLSRGPAAQTR